MDLEVRVQHFRKRNKAKFTRKKHSALGIISLLLAIICEASFVWNIYYSYTLRGKAPIQVGSIGVFLLIVSIVALVLGIKGLKEEDVYKLEPVLGTCISGVSILSWMSIYLIGFII